MNYEKAMEWVKALRSGDYKQTKDYLTLIDKNNQNKRHCCLGVFCEISGAYAYKKVIEKPIHTYNRVEYFTSSIAYTGSDALLPQSVKEWGEFKSQDPVFAFEIGDKYTKKELKFYSLSNLNDQGFTFSQIADIIERFWDQL